jgi:hypothetical protein
LNGFSGDTIKKNPDIYRIQDYTKGLDTVVVYYLGGFEYDYAILNVNGVKHSENVLYSKVSTELAGQNNIIFNKGSKDSITIEVLIFELNHQRNFEYNPLWYDYDSKYFIYYPPKNISVKIQPDSTKYIYIYFKTCESSISIKSSYMRRKYAKLCVSYLLRKERGIID